MRRTRLYVALSVLSLLMAGGLAIAQKKCEYFKDHRKLTSLFRTDCRNHCQVPTKKQAKPDASTAAYVAMRERDFDSMLAYAGKLDGKQKQAGQMLSAYALRGLGRYDEAAKAYGSAMQTPNGPEPDMSIMSDACIGRAHCRHMLGDAVGAHKDIGQAIGFGEILTAKYGEESDHYQLACAFAVQSGMLAGEASEAARRKALDQLVLAIEVGFTGWDHAAADLDMDALREDPAFQRLVQ